MLTALEARKIGIKACIDKIGFEFCMQHKDTSTTAYGENEGIMYCFVGVNDKPDNPNSRLILSDVKGFPYCASCNVNMSNGKIDFLECISYV